MEECVARGLTVTDREPECLDLGGLATWFSAVAETSLLPAPLEHFIVLLGWDSSQNDCGLWDIQWGWGEQIK